MTSREKISTKYPYIQWDAILLIMQGYPVGFFFLVVVFPFVCLKQCTLLCMYVYLFSEMQKIQEGEADNLHICSNAFFMNKLTKI